MNRNLKGTVKLVYPNGYGFIVIDSQDAKKIGVIRDIYFHATSLVDITIPWSEVQIGQVVRMGEIHHNGRGWQAVQVELL